MSTITIKQPLLSQDRGWGQQHHHQVVFVSVCGDDCSNLIYILQSHLMTVTWTCLMPAGIIHRARRVRGSITTAGIISTALVLEEETLEIRTGGDALGELQALFLWTK